MLCLFILSVWKSIYQSTIYYAYYILNLLKKNAATLYGKKYDFKNIKTINNYTKALPVVCYDDIKHYIEKIKEGQKNVFSVLPELMLEKTSGSTAASKYIPFNCALLSEIHNATCAWIYDLYKNNSCLLKSSSYWSVSPGLGSREVTKGGLKVGFDDDSQYFSGIERLFLKHIFALNPSSVEKLSGDEFYEQTSVSLLLDKYLGLISIWNPTFLIILLEFIENNKTYILKNLKSKKYRKLSNRVREIEKIFTINPKIDFSLIWPDLRLISCWTQGISNLFLPDLKKYFPHTRIQGKGLFLTEGVITIPVYGFNAPLLSINSHFYEFIDIENISGACLKNAGTLLPYQLEQGREYLPVISTGGGLYRYVAGDKVRVRGFYKDVPLLEFKGRWNNITDMCGEKLNENFVAQIISDINKEFFFNVKFSMLAPSLDPSPHYTYFIETQSENIVNPQQIADRLDQDLRKNHHYDLCRNLGQLSKVKIRFIKNGHATYLKTLSHIKKQKLGDIKHNALDSNFFWERKFSDKA